MEEPYFIPGAVACGVAILLCFVAPWQCAGRLGCGTFKPLRYYRCSTSPKNCQRLAYTAPSWFLSQVGPGVWYWMTQDKSSKDEPSVPRGPELALIFGMIEMKGFQRLQRAVHLPCVSRRRDEKEPLYALLDEWLPSRGYT